jgi:hypothetical protein
MCFTASTALSVSASNALTPSWLVPVGAGQASSRCGAPRLGWGGLSGRGLKAATARARSNAGAPQRTRQQSCIGRGALVIHAPTRRKETAMEYLPDLCQAPAADADSMSSRRGRAVQAPRGLPDTICALRSRTGRGGFDIIRRSLPRDDCQRIAPGSVHGRATLPLGAREARGIPALSLCQDVRASCSRPRSRRRRSTPPTSNWTAPGVTINEVDFRRAAARV